jgi:ATP-dependent exoDNAse (exonuclease V) alpha subunit
MVLANDTQEWTYVNGDLGHITGLVPSTDPDTGEKSYAFVVELVRTGREVVIGKIVRKNQQKDTPREYEHLGAGGIREKKRMTRAEAMGKGVPYWDDEGINERRPRWTIGEVIYYPLRLGWASTIHKSQGLSLDRVQVDTTAGFFGSPAMSYVSMSRCRTPQGLRVIGTPDNRKTKINPLVAQWL